MGLRLYNTLIRKQDVFRPLKKTVGLYTCGPTVYDFAHIGNFRSYVCADILKRYLKFRGFRVNHVMNITDVDDKTIKRSIKEGIPLKELTRRYEKAFFQDLKSLNIQKADVFPRATGHIAEMVALVRKLLEKKIAYAGDDGSVYFDITRFKGYGKLSHANIHSLKEGARVRQDQYGKDDAKDFALWKAYAKDDAGVFWNTPLGKGRPGWHVECSAMSTKYLGQPFDIHAGGIDLVFPHHENEIAQSEGAAGKPLARYWFHNEHLLVDGRKMSKSLGNYLTLRDLLHKGHGLRAIRYLLLSVHYRQQLNLTDKGIKSAQNAVDRLQTFVDTLLQSSPGSPNAVILPLLAQARKDFTVKMDDDLNISEALSVIFNLVSTLNKHIGKGLSKSNIRHTLDFMKSIDGVLGVLDFTPVRAPREVQDLLLQREQAREEKDFSKSDALREIILQKGYIVEDTDKGTVIRRSPRPT